MVWSDMKIWWNAVRFGVTNKLAAATSASTRVVILQLKKDNLENDYFETG